MIVLQFLVPMLVSAMVITVLLRRGAGLLPLDRENHRSLHRGSVPRIGGVGIIVAASWSVWRLAALNAAAPWALLVGASALLLVSLWDDFRSVPSGIRFLVHLLAAGLMLIWLGLSDGIGFLPALLLIVWSVNLYNFMDGMDGLAAAMAISGFGALAGLGYLAGAQEYMLAMLGMAAAAAGFLLFNLPPARLFMGDVGSTFLGFMAAAGSLWGWLQGLFPWWAPLLIFLPFWLDATLTLLRRVLRGERFWEAHRSHFYQRAVLSGVPVGRVLLLEVIVMLCCAATAVGGVMFWRGA